METTQTHSVEFSTKIQDKDGNYFYEETENGEQKVVESGGTVQYRFGANLQEMREILGDEVVHGLALAKAVIFVQDAARKIIQKELGHKTENASTKVTKAVLKACQAAVDGIKPGVPRVRGLGKIEKAERDIKKLSQSDPGRLAALLDALKAQIISDAQADPSLLENPEFVTAAESAGLSLADLTA